MTKISVIVGSTRQGRFSEKPAQWILQRLQKREGIVASDGITANAVLRGLTNTLATAPQSEEQKRSTWEQQAIKRLGEPEDVTGAILFLTSDDASFITGEAIVVDGGQYRIG